MAVLNKRTLNGLGILAGLAEAGAPDDTLGCGQTMTAENKRDWADVQRACQWIRQKQHDYQLTHRQESSASSK